MEIIRAKSMTREMNIRPMGGSLLGNMWYTWEKDYMCFDDNIASHVSLEATVLNDSMCESAHRLSHGIVKCFRPIIVCDERLRH